MPEFTPERRREIIVSARKLLEEDGFDYNFKHSGRIVYDYRGEYHEAPCWFEADGTTYLDDEFEIEEYFLQPVLVSGWKMGSFIAYYLTINFDERLVFSVGEGTLYLAGLWEERLINLANGIRSSKLFN